MKGVELNLQAPFTFLAAPFDGFGVAANVAFIDAHATGVSGRSGQLPLALQSDTVATAQVFYEKYGFLPGSRGPIAPSTCWPPGRRRPTTSMWRALARSTRGVSYTYGPATVFLEGSNLNDEPYRIYVGSKDRVIENERYDYTLRTGVQLAF